MKRSRVTAMKKLIFILLMGFILSENLTAQSASDYMPVLNSSWTIESVATLDDEIIEATTRKDSLVSIEPDGEYTVYSIYTSENLTYKLDTRGDTLFIRLARILGSDIFDEDLIELDVDPDERLPLAIFSTEVNEEWELYHLEQTIELSDSIKAAFPDDVNFEDEADIEIKVTGVRLADETITLPVGDITTYIFDARIELSLTLFALLFGQTFPVEVDLIDDLTIRSYIGHERGIVQQYNEEYDVIARHESQFLSFSEYIFTLAANNSTMIEFTEGDPTFVAESDTRSPQVFSLRQNYPNPFNPATRIVYTLAERSHVNVTVYNILGAKITTLVDKEQQQGTHLVTFDASHLPSGVYFYTLQTGDFIETRRMVLSK